MIQRLHSRFIWHSFLLVCIILFVIFLIAGIALVRYVDHSIKKTLTETLQTEDKPGTVKEKPDLAGWLGLDSRVEPTVGGMRFPSYLLEIRQAKTDLQAKELFEADQIGFLRGDQPQDGEAGSWRVLIDVMLKSSRQFDRVNGENLCFTVDRSGESIRIAVVDYSGYLLFLNRLLVACGVMIISLAGVFLILIWIVAMQILQPAERAWERQERFVGDASHEIKTPLAIILSTAELSAAEDPKENERRFGVIRDEARRINLLISRMLESARIRSKAAQHSNDTVFSLTDAVTECALRYEALLYEEGIELIADIEDGVYVRTDENALKQVICSLLDNAVKYTPKGCAATVSLRKRYREAEITVRNEGIGIKQSERTVIFDRFYRADEGRAHKEGSYGLGLAIAKNLVETMGGRIRCESDGETYTAFVTSMRTIKPPKTAKNP